MSGDRDAGGFTRTMDGLPFVAVPLGDKRPAIEDAVPCTGYPTPGIVNAKTGAVLDPDAFGKVTLDSLKGWISEVA